MSDSLQLRLVRLLCLRSEARTEQLGIDEISFALGCSTEELIETKAVFVAKGFISDSWEVLNWDKRQFSGQKSTLPAGGPRSRGYVYYVADRSHFVAGKTLVKIGYSGNPWARIKELRTAVPGLEILAMEPGDFDYELSIHQKFSHLRRDGEWFQSGSELMNYVAKLRSSYVATPTMATYRADTEQIQNRQKPSRAKRTSDGMKHSSDPRHLACKDAISRYWKSKNPDLEMPWDGSEGKALGMLLGASPDLDAGKLLRLLANRAKSDGVVHSERPSKWLRAIHSYASGPLDRFGKTLHGGNGNGHRYESRLEQAKREAIALLDSGAPGGGSGGAEREPGRADPEVLRGGAGEVSPTRH